MFGVLQLASRIDQYTIAVTVVAVLVVKCFRGYKWIIRSAAAAVVVVPKCGFPIKPALNQVIHLDPGVCGQMIGLANQLAKATCCWQTAIVYPHLLSRVLASQHMRWRVCWRAHHDKVNRLLFWGLATRMAHAQLLEAF